MTEGSTGPPSAPRRCILDDFTDAEIDEILEDLPGGQRVHPATRRLYQRLLDMRRVPRQQTPEQGPMLPGMSDMVLAPAQLVRKMPDQMPEIGWIYSKRDATGTNGVGFIGLYLICPDGAVVTRWFGGPPQGEGSWRFFDTPGTAPITRMGSHTGDIVLVSIPLEQGEEM